MTTIILVIIGILLAAAAAMFVVFYGGDAFDSSTAEAEANTVISQGTQIDTAMRLYRVERGAYPGQASGAGALDELVDKKYLDQIPERRSSDGYDTNWKIDYERGIARTTIGARENDTATLVCSIARQRSGFEGEPKSCDDPTISNNDPCCVMPAAEL